MITWSMIWQCIRNIGWQDDVVWSREMYHRKNRFKELSRRIIVLVTKIQGGLKVTNSKNFEYLYCSSSKQADFSISDRSIFKLSIHKDIRIEMSSVRSSTNKKTLLF